MAKFNPDTYESVDERISKFYDDHPTGAILTKLESDPNLVDSVVFKAAVYFEMGGDIRATGYASEERGKSFSDGANFASWVENCETSAIGRALANAGYKAKKDGNRPSREEMDKAGRVSTSTAVADRMEADGKQFPGMSYYDGPEDKCPGCMAPKGKRHATKCKIGEPK